MVLVSYVLLVVLYNSSRSLSASVPLMAISQANRSGNGDGMKAQMNEPDRGTGPRAKAIASTNGLDMMILHTGCASQFFFSPYRNKEPRLQPLSVDNSRHLLTFSHLGASDLHSFYFRAQ